MGDVVGILRLVNLVSEASIRLTHRLWTVNSIPFTPFVEQLLESFEADRAAIVCLCITQYLVDELAADELRVLVIEIGCLERRILAVIAEDEQPPLLRG